MYGLHLIQSTIDHGNFFLVLFSRDKTIYIQFSKHQELKSQGVCLVMVTQCIVHVAKIV